MQTVMHVRIGMNGEPVFGNVDEFGNIVKRPPATHPYSYDPFVVWEHPERNKSLQADDTVYTDRLWQWDYSKAEKLCFRHWGNVGQMFYDREPEQIQAFLRDYLDVPNLTLVLIMQCVHLGNGYPLWRFDFVRG